ncbi:hypothetical protein [Saccharothrix sp. HUAS TT1]|uniref:hypothetical protein n=1 Tax=unclassified Saccharothrix TaxID=2593673 RepID=UPI00345C154B
MTNAIAPQLAPETDILIVGFTEERRAYPQFRHWQVYAASAPLTMMLSGRRFRRAYFTDGAQRMKGFDRLADTLHDRVAKGEADMIVHVSAYERLTAADEADRAARHAAPAHELDLLITGERDNPADYPQFERGQIVRAMQANRSLHGRHLRRVYFTPDAARSVLFAQTRSTLEYQVARGTAELIAPIEDYGRLAEADAALVRGLNQARAFQA